MSNKYGARRVEVDGIVFSSAKEARRYGELVLLERAGEIAVLRLQVPFTLARGVVLGGRKRPAIRYYADFRYKDMRSGEMIVEDVKGVRTAVYIMKRHLMMSVYGIEIRET